MPQPPSSNPYSPPESSDADRARALDGRSLQCASCQKKTVRVFSAFLRHPQMAIVCPECGARHRLTFRRSSQFRYHAVALPAIGLGVIAIILALRNQTYRTLDVIVARIIQYFGWSIARNYISVIEATSLLIVLLTPVLLAAWYAIRAQLRMIANEGILQQRPR